jgi:hypothetical protein
MIRLKNTIASAGAEVTADDGQEKMVHCNVPRPPPCREPTGTKQQPSFRLRPSGAPNDGVPHRPAGRSAKVAFTPGEWRLPKARAL